MSLTDLPEDTPQQMEAKADALTAYWNALPDGVSSEAGAEASLLRSRAVEARVDLVAKLPSPWRTPEQMDWIAKRYKLDGLGRLARANRQYADEHGEYLPDVAALAHAALTELERVREPVEPRSAVGFAECGDAVEMAEGFAAFYHHDTEHDVAGLAEWLRQLYEAARKVLYGGPETDDHAPRVRPTDVSPFPHPEFGQESERSVPAALQAAVTEVEALRLMSYTGGAADLREEDVRGIRDLLIDLTLLLAERTGEPLPEPEAIL